MSRLGLTNIYLKSGVLLILFGPACAASIFIVMPRMGGAVSQVLLWGAAGGFLSGVALYVIGRIAQFLGQFGRTRSQA